MQPLVKDKEGVIRFQANAIVNWMLSAGGRGDRFSMNTLADIPFSDEDREQFAQLIGYSLSGYGELSYVSDESFTLAERAARRLATRTAVKKRKRGGK